jgi:two-component system LytT family sensor kinase
MLTLHQPQLVNALAHFAATVIFAIFLLLLFRDRAGSRIGANWLSLAAASLAFIWNLGSVAVLIVPPRFGRTEDVLVAISFAALSLLPAVLLHHCLKDAQMRPLIVAGYVTSAFAVGLHLFELFRAGVTLHQVGLTVVTFGFAVLTALSVAGTLRNSDRSDRGRMARILASMCLALLAISFAHFGSEHMPQPWSKELILHHASLPLALLILLQDDRFILLDAFVRFLVNVLLAALTTALVLGSEARRWTGVGMNPLDPLYEAVLFASVALLLIVFAFVRGTVQRWLTRVVFHRGDLDRAIRELRRITESRPGERQFLDAACAHLASFMGALRCQLLQEGDLRDDLLGREVIDPLRTSELAGIRARLPIWANAILPLRLPQGDMQYMLLGRRHGGRRYLSEDMYALSRMGAVIAEEVGRIRDVEMKRLVGEAELRALQSQINPHFLFNALNTLYGIIPRDAAGARRTVLNLSEVFRYCLNISRTYIPLSEELKIVNAYLEIERLRLGSRLRTELDIDPDALPVPIPVLSVQPLVENAIKHGVSAKPEGGRLKLSAKLVDDELRISVDDTGPGLEEARRTGSAGTGVGIANVTRRLQLCYGEQNGVTIRSGSNGTHVEFAIPLVHVTAGT